MRGLRFSPSEIHSPLCILLGAAVLSEKWIERQMQLHMGANWGSLLRLMSTRHGVRLVSGGGG